MRKGLFRYFSAIKRKLPCSGKVKRQLLAELKSSINTYLSENPTAGRAQIEQQFGTPEQIAASWLYEMDQQTLISQLRLKNRIIKIVLAAILAALLMFASILGYLLYDDYYVDNGYIEVIMGPSGPPSTTGGN